LAKDGQVELQAQLSEADLAFVRPGQRVTVTLQSGAAVPGRVRLVSPAVDSQTKLGFVRIQLPVRSDVRAGGFARAIFGEASAPAVSVPETAVRYDADGASVLVVDARNRVRRVAVQAGQRGGGLVQLLKGPPAGTLVVRSSGAFLLDGDLVRPVAEATVPSRTAGPR
jgi:HlyD family secretion protein